MNRPLLAFALFAVASAVVSAQQASQPNPYQGTSNPPPDNTIEVTSGPQAKPQAGQPLNAPAPAPARAVPSQAQAAPDNAQQDNPPQDIRRRTTQTPDWLPARFRATARSFTNMVTRRLRRRLWQLGAPWPIRMETLCIRHRLGPASSGREPYSRRAARPAFHVGQRAGPALPQQGCIGCTSRRSGGDSRGRGD